MANVLLRSLMSASHEVRGNTLKVYLYLLRHGPCELRDVQHEIGLSSASLASYHLGKLSDAGFVMQDERGRYFAVKEASDRVLDGYARMGPAIVPQSVLFRVAVHCSRSVLFLRGFVFIGFHGVLSARLFCHDLGVLV